MSRARRAAIKTVYSAYQTLSGVNRPLGPSTDGLHPRARGREWNESYYFNFFDPRAGIGGWTRIGLLPNQELDHGLMVVYWKDERTLGLFDRKRTPSRARRLILGGLEYTCLEPMKTWKVRYRGNLSEIGDEEVIGLEPTVLGDGTAAEIDLTFEGISPLFDVRDVDPGVLADMLVESGATIGDVRKAGKVSHRHYEQAGKVTGRIAIGGDEVRLEGGGHRDHSWGVRDWSAPNFWNFATCQFDDAMAFSFSRVSVGNMVLRFGHVIEHGQNYAIGESSLDVDGDLDPRRRKIAMTMTHSTGKSSEVSGKVVRLTPVAFETDAGQVLINEALAEYRWNGRTGFGIFEILESGDGRK